MLGRWKENASSDDPPEKGQYMEQDSEILRKVFYRSKVRKERLPDAIYDGKHIAWYVLLDLHFRLCWLLMHTGPSLLSITSCETSSLIRVDGVALSVVAPMFMEKRSVSS